MKKELDFTGKRFGKLVAIEVVGKTKWNHRAWLCKCDCGKETIVSGGHLKLSRFSTKSCGCKKSEISRKTCKDRSECTHRKCSCNHCISYHVLGDDCQKCKCNKFDGYRNAKKYIDSHPEKSKARRNFSSAIARGKIKRGVCEVCKKSNAQGHHTDYTKHLEVRWLCPKHHKAVHLRKIGLLDS